MLPANFVRRILPIWIVAAAFCAAPPAGASAPASTAKAKLPAADEFKTAAAATAHCPGDVVVWSALSASHSYHLATSRYYGKTKRGAYVCEKDAAAAGYHASKE